MAGDERAQHFEEHMIKKQISSILPSNGQLLMHLAGSGGTGKSLVVKALVDFTQCWKAARSVIITASSGVAAMLIGGSTLHSALGIQVSHYDSPTHKIIKVTLLVIPVET